MEQFGVRGGTLQHVLEGYKVADEIAAHGAGGSCFADWWGYKYEVIDAIPYAGSLMRERGDIYAGFTDVELRGLLQAHSGDVAACHETVLRLQAAGAARGVSSSELFRQTAPPPPPPGTVLRGPYQPGGPPPGWNRSPRLALRHGAWQLRL